MISTYTKIPEIWYSAGKQLGYSEKICYVMNYSFFWNINYWLFVFYLFIEFSGIIHTNCLLSNITLVGIFFSQPFLYLYRFICKIKTSIGYHWWWQSWVYLLPTSVLLVCHSFFKYGRFVSYWHSFWYFIGVIFSCLVYILTSVILKGGW